MSNFVNEADELLAPYIAALASSVLDNNPKFYSGGQFAIGNFRFDAQPNMLQTGNLKCYVLHGDKSTLVYERSLNLMEVTPFYSGQTLQFHAGKWIYALMDLAEPLMAEAARKAMDKALAHELERQGRFVPV